MRHTDGAVALAPHLPERYDVDGRARAVYLRVSARAEVRRRLVAADRHRWYRVRRADVASRALSRVGEELCELRRAGATEQEARAYATYVESLIADLWPSDETLLPALDREETRLDGQEDLPQLVRTQHQVTPESYAREAGLREQTAAINVAMARTLRHLSRATDDYPRPMGVPPLRRA